jgi:hypothetical protein
MTFTCEDRSKRWRLCLERELPWYHRGFVVVDDARTGRTVMATSDLAAAVERIDGVERRTVELYGGCDRRSPKYVWVCP